MKKTLIAMMTAAMALSAPAFSEEKELTAQQQKMKDCNADAKAKELKGDERKAFMKECLSAEKSAKQAAAAEPPAKEKN